jgi:Tol biopolymer transport system component
MSVLENRQSRSEPAAASGTRPPNSRLDSWKEIAAYLGRGVRTVQRWEREEGLPVHRLAHEKRGSVYADRHEVDVWWESRRQTLTPTGPSAEPAAASASNVPERITWMSAATFWPAVSSDGRLLAYVSDGGRDGSSPQIWLRQIGGSAVCLTSGVAERSHLAFSADDTHIVFTTLDDTGQNAYTIPTLGGEPRMLTRGAKAARPSPDGRWLAYIATDDHVGVRLASLEKTNGVTERTIAPNLTDVAFAIWSPDGRHVLLHAHPDSASEADYWIAAIDGSPAANTGIAQRFRQRGAWPISFPATWVGDSLVFSAITPLGVAVWRQRLDPSTLQPSTEPERLTRGTEFDWFPTAAAGRVAYVSTHPDQNIWSVELDPATGMSRGPLRRLTRGPGFVGHLSVTRDARTLAYFFGRPKVVGIMLRDLESGTESELTTEPRLEYGHPALSPSGAQLACGARVAAARATRPIYVVSIPDGTNRKLGDDFGARPRQWIDERYLVVERFGGRLNSVGVVDTTTAGTADLLVSSDRTIMNPRVSNDGRWVAFDAARPGGPPTVHVARMRADDVIPETEWLPVDRSATHAFWSVDGDVLYYVPTTPSMEFRNVVRARRFATTANDVTLGDPFTAFSTSEMVMPAASNAMTPVATRDQLIFVLGDFRGDVWMMDVTR